jgi:hypothetical protein
MTDSFSTAEAVFQNVVTKQDDNERALKLLTRPDALDVAEILGLK